MEMQIKEFCEENLGRNWEVKFTRHNVYVSFEYRTNKLINIRPEFKGTDSQDVVEQISKRLPELIKHGIIL